jgi:putative ubiquitin-RnfH superfamily antitoxin RatB of RatAB toxin-antitoxin module
MNYQQAVSEARRLTKRSEEDSWRLAELSHQVCVVEKKATHRSWGSDIGLSHAQVGIYVRAYERFGSGPFQDRPLFWKACEAIRKGIEPDEANANRASRPGTIAKLPEPDRIKIAREVLKDPEVARSVVADRTTRRALADARAELDDEAVEMQETREPALRHAREASDKARVLYRLIHLRRQLARELRSLGDVRLRKSEREDLLEEVEGFETTIGWLRSLVESGDRSLEDELEELLREMRRLGFEEVGPK